jgi:putative DNA primase/helicase
MGKFVLDEHGVWFETPAKKEGEQPDRTWVCSPLDILAITRDHDNENHGKLLRFYDYDGVEHKWPMPLELLAGDGATYRQVLLSGGMRLAESKTCRELLNRYIQSCNPKERMRCVNRLGWYGDLYILPNETLGAISGEVVVFQANVPLVDHHDSKGTLQEWQQNVAKYCVDNSRLCFSMSVGFAAPLLHLLGEENGGFNLRGPSSGGKTTALKVALSVYGGEKMLQSWRATSNGLESIAAMHNDGLLCLDELGKLEPKIAGETAYLLVNGTGKQRSDRSGFARKKQTWRILFLSSGEVGLPDLIRQSGQKVRGGHEVRVVDIPAYTDKYGVFEHLHFVPSGNEFSRLLCANVEKYHGTAGKAFINALIKDLSQNLGRLRQLIDRFKQKNTPVNADGQVLRVLNRFALVAAAGTLATELSVTGWTDEDAFWAAKICFEAWLKNRGGLSAQEGQEVLRQVRRYLEQHGDSRFATFDCKDEQKTFNRSGYRKQVDGGVHYFVLSESFKQEVCIGFDLSIAVDVLKERQWLMPDSDGKSTRAENLPCSTSTTRCYRLDGNRIFSDDI